LQIGKCKLQIEDVPVALLAGGLATRLGHAAATVPKAMVEVAGRPFIEHQLELLHRNGIRRVVLCLGHLGEQIEDHLGDGSRFAMELRYRHDGKAALGTGGAVRSALPELGDVFWVMYGDSYMDIDYSAVLEKFDQNAAALGLMTVIRNDDRWDRSNVIFRGGRLMRYDKKNRAPDMRYIDYGVQILRSEAAERLIANRPADVADLYRVLVSEGRMVGHEVNRRFYEIGTPGSLEETRRFLGNGINGTGASPVFLTAG
jgi:NDP-sugar pyrophosphorylase family protein